MKQITICLLSLIYFTVTAQIKVSLEDTAKHVGDSVSAAARFKAVSTWNTAKDSLH